MRKNMMIRAVSMAFGFMACIGTAQAGGTLWNGGYVGLEGGYGWGSARQTDSKWSFDSGSYSTSGGLAGVEAGYNWKAGPVLLGLEGDLSWSGITGSTPGQTNNKCAGTTSKCEADLVALGTTRARVGYPIGRFLPFLSGGLAVGDVHGKEGDNDSNGGSGSKIRLGWTAGGGIEHSFAEHWTAKVEYLYVDLGKQETFRDSFSNGTAMESIQMRDHIVRAAINYKF